MKKLIFILILAPLCMQAQVLGYTDAAVLFSTDDNYGTARYMGLSGAMGALGGDMSAAEINPAGLAVFNYSEFSMTLGYSNVDNTSSFYGTGIQSSDDRFDFPQTGGVFIFYTGNQTGFNKFAFGMNYTQLKNFDNAIFARGNSGVPDFVDDPYLNYDENPFNNVFYDNVDQQEFKSYTNGSNSKFNFSFASQYNDILYLGMNLNFYYLDFYQSANYSEFNNDGNNNTLDAYVDQYLEDYGDGFSFSLGVIVKPIENLRIGASYKSPVWYDISETYIEDLEINLSNTSDTYYEYGNPNYFDYDVNTPSELTGSLAYIFGKNGLISFDYIYKDFQNIELQPTGDFIDENQYISENLRGTSSYRIGTEWILNSFSVRGGYRFEQSPYKDGDIDQDLTGYSLGLGIRFTRSVRLDLSYDQYNRDYTYQFLNIDIVNPAVIKEDTYRLNSSLVFSF
ncbi:MAG: outer membrane protein transport protein [Flavobacteriaceae bacterium]|nr:outer membrane protein transport protein [Flavobacteriaceae bacterium]